MGYESENRVQYEILEELRKNNEELRAIRRELAPHHPTHIKFQEITMNPTEAGETQVFTGTLIPAGSAFPQDAQFTVSSNDAEVSPAVDASGLVVSVTYPDGWLEAATTPLVFSYAATSASNPTWTLTATITPSAPPPPPPPAAPPLPTAIAFAQTE